MPDHTQSSLTTHTELPVAQSSLSLDCTGAVTTLITVSDQYQGDGNGVTGSAASVFVLPSSFALYDNTVTPPPGQFQPVIGYYTLDTNTQNGAGSITGTDGAGNVVSGQKLYRTVENDLNSFFWDSSMTPSYSSRIGSPSGIALKSFVIPFIITPTLLSLQEISAQYTTQPGEIDYVGNVDFMLTYL